VVVEHTKLDYQTRAGLSEEAVRAVNVAFLGLVSDGKEPADEFCAAEFKSDWH
jgi:hypothetical protein